MNSQNSESTINLEEEHSKAENLFRDVQDWWSGVTYDDTGKREDKVVDFFKSFGITDENIDQNLSLLSLMKEGIAVEDPKGFGAYVEEFSKELRRSIKMSVTNQKDNKPSLFDAFGLRRDDIPSNVQYITDWDEERKIWNVELRSSVPDPLADDEDTMYWNK